MNNISRTKEKELVEKRANLTISVNFECAKSLLGFIEQPKSPEFEPSRLIRLHGNRVLVREMHALNRNINLDTFENSLIEIGKGKLLENDPFQLNKIIENYGEIKTFIEYFENNLSDVLQNIYSMLSKFIPEGIFIKADLNLIIGGGIDGFEENLSCYIAIHHVFNDIESFKLIAAHEVFHVIHKTIIEEKNNNNEKRKMYVRDDLNNIHNLFFETINEGLSLLVANPISINSNSDYIKQMRKFYSENTERMDGNFILFESLLFRMYYDRSVSYDTIKNIGFSSAWGMPLYYVGYFIVNAINDYLGQKYLITLLGDIPKIFQCYIKLYKSNEMASEIIRFSTVAEKLIFEISGIENYG